MIMHKSSQWIILRIEDSPALTQKVYAFPCNDGAQDIEFEPKFVILYLR